MNHYVELAKIDVSRWIEKKGPHKLDYLSWAVAVDLLMRADPTANWEFHEPKSYGDTMMVSCTVTAFGKPIGMHLPVMDAKNAAIKEPDAFQVNKAMMRCLVKAIACHGLGIRVYAGEDLPDDEKVDKVESHVYAIQTSQDVGELKHVFTVAHQLLANNPEALERITKAKDKRKAELS
jgi:hypothetical protein